MGRGLLVEGDLGLRQAIDRQSRVGARGVVLVAGREVRDVVEEDAPEHVVDLQATAAAQLAGHGGDRPQVIVDDVPPVDRKHQAVGVGPVRIGLVTERAMLDLATGSHQFVLVLADEPVAGHSFEVADVADGADVPPGAFDREEAVEQELVGDVGQDAADGVRTIDEVLRQIPLPASIADTLPASPAIRTDSMATIRDWSRQSPVLPRLLNHLRGIDPLSEPRFDLARVIVWPNSQLVSAHDASVTDQPWVYCLRSHGGRFSDVKSSLRSIVTSLQVEPVEEWSSTKQRLVRPRWDSLDSSIVGEAERSIGQLHAVPSIKKRLSCKSPRSPDSTIGWAAKSGSFPFRFARTEDAVETAEQSGP